jgi:hypothetical protein
MPEAALTEFWKDIKPIEKVFHADALPEIYAPNAPGGDERLFVPFNETVFSKPLWISPSQNRWADVLMCKAVGLVNRHYYLMRFSRTQSRARGVISNTTGPPPPATSSMSIPAKHIRLSPTSILTR